MRTTRLAIISALAVTAGLSSASAQTPAPTTPPPPRRPPAPAAAAARPRAAPARRGAPASGAADPRRCPRRGTACPRDPEPAPAPAEEEESFPAAWFRIDSDLGSLQLWAGATHMLSDTVGIATDIYVHDVVARASASASSTSVRRSSPARCTSRRWSAAGGLDGIGASQRSFPSSTSRADPIPSTWSSGCRTTRTACSTANARRRRWEHALLPFLHRLQDRQILRRRSRDRGDGCVS